MEEICQSLVELSRNLFDIDAWQHYRDVGYETFDSYCENALGIHAPKAQVLMTMNDQRLPGPRKFGPAELFSWFFKTVDILGKTRLS